MILSSWLLAASLLFSPPPSLPSNVLLSTNAGCLLQQISTPDNQSSRWYLYVWLSFPPSSAIPEWRSLYSIRSANERHKSLRDCSQWMDLWEKTLKRKEKKSNRYR